MDTRIKIHCIDPSAIASAGLASLRTENDLKLHENAADLLLAAQEDRKANFPSSKLFFIIPSDPTLAPETQRKDEALQSVKDNIGIDLTTSEWSDPRFKYARGTKLAATLQSLWPHPHVACIVYSTKSTSTELASGKYVCNIIRKNKPIPDLCPTAGKPFIGLVTLSDDADPAFLAKIIDHQCKPR